jgi:hypothetical protein
VVGVPRSGTTLLAAFLSAHPRIAISPETHFFSRWLPRYAPRALRRGAGSPPAAEVRAFWSRVTATPRFSWLGVDAAAAWALASADGAPDYRSVFAALGRAYGQARAKPRWGEKTPAHDAAVPRLLEWFPAARVLYVLRDPRAVIHSLLKTPWGARHTPDLHALRWRRSVRRMHGWGGDPRIRVVRYERLVAEPAAELAAICAFLDEGFDERMITGRSRASSPIVGRSGWAREHLDSALESVSTDAVDRWRRELPITTVAVVEHYAAAEMEREGYARTTAGIGPLRRAALLAGRMVQRARRRLRPQPSDGPARSDAVGAP